MKLNMGTIRGEVNTMGFPGPPGKDGITPEFKHTITNIIGTNEEASVIITGPADDLTITFNIPEGKQGIQGEKGTSIVDIQLTGHDGTVDIYTIFLSDGSTHQFEIRNAVDESGNSAIQQVLLNGTKIEPIEHAVNINSAVAVKCGNTAFNVDEQGTINMNDLVLNCGSSTEVVE